MATRARHESELWNSNVTFSLAEDGITKPLVKIRKRKTVSNSLKNRPFASAASALSDKFVANTPPPPATPPPPSTKVDLKPASDVIAGAVARAASQGTIHPLDTLKVQLQSGKGRKPNLSKIGQLVPPSGAEGAKQAAKAVKKTFPRIAGLYRGVFGAASGAGIAIGAYFAFYGAATNILARKTDMPPAQIAFFAGGIAAAGGSVVKVPLAVCIRSVQAGVYPNVIKAAQDIVQAAGVRGLFTGYMPTLMEDVPDMAFKFASYETLRKMHAQVFGRTATAKEDFAMGAASGAFAAAATTPLDVIKTSMMCSAASRPNMLSASREIWARGGPTYFFRGVGARALSNGINSAVFFCFFEALRSSFKKRKERALKLTAVEADTIEQPKINTKMALKRVAPINQADMSLQPASISIKGRK